jgi:hypothetical protein
MVPRGGIEPPRCFHRRILSPLRLPIPPSRLGITESEPEEVAIIADSPAGDKRTDQHSWIPWTAPSGPCAFLRRPLFACSRSTTFDFDLPGELIAQHPTTERTGSRLLQLTDGALHDRRFGDLAELIEAGDLLVFNDTRVIRARLLGRKDSGGQIEVLIERIVDARPLWLKSAPASRRNRAAGWCPRRDDPLIVRGRSGQQDEFFELELAGAGNLWDLIDRYGRLPLPPYINHAAGRDDEAVIRPSLPASPARSPRPPPACISTRRCSRNSPQAALTSPG